MGLTPPPEAPTSRRDELSAFLRSRRARLTPADVGLPDDGSRRRTPGLRREELAQLAGVGVSWYTWLEQGRDINASPQVLDALARALRLDPAEREALYALARTELPLPDGDPAAGALGDVGALDDLVALVASLHPHPAWLMGPMTRVLAINRAAEVVLGRLGRQPTLLEAFFLDGEPLTEQESTTARNVVARFRVEYARHAGEPEYEAFVARLRDGSERFASWWDEHDVTDVQRGTKTIDHPSLGRLFLRHAQTIPTGTPELRLAVYAPGDDATRAALATL